MSIYQEAVKGQADEFLKWYGGGTVIEAVKTGDTAAVRQLLKEYLGHFIHEGIFAKEDALVVIGEILAEEDNIDLPHSDRLCEFACQLFREDIGEEVFRRYDLVLNSLSTLGEDERAARTEEVIAPLVVPALEEVEPGSDEEKDLLIEWFRLRDKADVPDVRLGEYRIDKSLGYGLSAPDKLRLDMLETRFWERLPHLRTRRSAEVKEYFVDVHLGMEDASAEMLGEKLLEMVQENADPVELSVMQEVYRARVAELTASVGPSM